MAVILAVLAYVGYEAYQAGGLTNLMRRIQGEATPSPTASAVPSPTAPMPTAAASPTVPSSPGARTVLDTMNARRAHAGAAPLAANAILAREAQEHASDMAARQYFSHSDPDGVTFQQRMNASGYPPSNVAENLGLTSGEASEVVSFWMESTDHRANMLGAQYVAAGVGVATGTWQGRPVKFVVAIFGQSR
jgi:uncharacterized protein YkwD